MDKLILVPLTRSDRAEDFVPYIVEVARPGMKAVFMVPYPVDGFRWSHEECGRKAIQEGMALADYYNWDNNFRKAKEIITPAVESLSAQGVDADVELYTGSMRRALREYAAKSETHLIVSGAGIGQKIAARLNGRSSLFGLFKRPSFSSVLLIQPGAFA